MNASNNEHAITTYVSDMLALERHIRIPFDTQSNDGDLAKYSDAVSIVNRLVATSDRHIAALEQCLQRLGGHEASPAKSAVTQIEGAFAGAIDKMRKTKVSKSLRDDYTALSLCTAGYTMLAATANALGQPDVARLAELHLRDYAQCVMEIGRSLPAVVVAELQETGVAVQAGTVEQTRRIVVDMWRGGDESQTTSAGYATESAP